MAEREYIEHMKNPERCFLCGGVIEVNQEAYKRVDLEHPFSRIPFQESRNVTYTHPECEEDATKKEEKAKDLLGCIRSVIIKRIDAMREGKADRDLRSLRCFVEGVFDEAREDYYKDGRD